MRIHAADMERSVPSRQDAKWNDPCVARGPPWGQNVPAMTKHLYLREWRQLRGLSQAALGERVGVTHRTIGLWEAGKRNPPLQKQADLARELGIQPYQLWGQPNARSIDAMLEGASEDERQMVVDMVHSILTRLRR